MLATRTVSPGHAGASPSLGLWPPQRCPRLCPSEGQAPPHRALGWNRVQLPGASGAVDLGDVSSWKELCSLGNAPRPAHCCLCRPSSSLPKAPDPPLLLLSCFPACVQKWRELFPAPLSPPLTGGVGAAPLFPWDSEKQTNAQGGCYLSPLPPRTLLSSAGFSSPTWGP